MASKLTTLVALYFLARYLGDSLFGRYSVALAIPAALEPLADLGISIALIREGAGRPDAARRLALAAVGPKLALAAMTIIATYLIALELGMPPEIAEAAFYLAVAKGLDSLTFLARAVFQANERMEYEGALLVLDGAVRLVFTAFALVNGFGLVGLAKALAVASAVVMVATVFVATQRFLRPLAFRLEFPVRLVAEGVPLAAVWLLDQLVMRIGIVSVAARVGDAEAGRFAAAVRLVEPLLIVPAMMAATLLPMTSRHLAERPQTVPWLFHASLKLAVLAALAMATPLVGLAPLVIDLVFGPDFAGAAMILRVLGAALVPLFVHVLLVSFLLAFRAQRPLIVGQALGVVVNGAIAVGLVTAFGSVIAAVAVLAGEFVMIGALLATVPRLRELKFFGAVKVAALGLPVLAVLATTPLVGGPVATLLALATIIFGVRLFGLVHERELAYLEGVAPRFSWLSRLLLEPFGSR